MEEIPNLAPPSRESYCSLYNQKKNIIRCITTECGLKISLLTAECQGQRTVTHVTVCHMSAAAIHMHPMICTVHLTVS